VDGLAIGEEMVEIFAVEIVTRESVGESPLVIVKRHARIYVTSRESTVHFISPGYRTEEYQ
jgi:hypothetical protein